LTADDTGAIEETELSVVWDSVKFDGSPHRSVDVLGLGTTDDGRWLFLSEGTLVRRPHRGDYLHPCDAVVLVPPEGLWIATWLVAWDPALYVDLAQQVTVDDERVVTIDLDVDVIRRRSGEVATLDVEEFDLHRRQLGYPSALVTAVRRETQRLADAIAREQPPFRSAPTTPTLLRSPDAW
jgi:hypothetical protein